MDRPTRPRAAEESLLHNFGTMGFDREGEIEDVIAYADAVERYWAEEESVLMAELGGTRQRLQAAEATAEQLKQELAQAKAQNAFYELKLNAITLIMR